ncbi:MAG: hypothetical protein LBO08_03175 [Rickettsiales bacterium]|jgi:hypothetical protein|nr:hypothetical protein [Rickettsiales bacterium]
MFDRQWFFDLESRLRAAGLDSDRKTFAQILDMLFHPRRVSPDEFATECIYVILAGGFSQKTAKIIHGKIICSLQDSDFSFDSLFAIFHNKNKINAIIKIWSNRREYCDNYYSAGDKLQYLAMLPHIGKITANHLARNLGENVFKPDVWIVRLADRFFGGDMEKMFARLESETGLPRGYIDVVLWKACQVGMIELKG